VLEGRAGDGSAARAAERVSDRLAVYCLRAERALAGALRASCLTPLGALAVADAEDRLTLSAWVGLPDGSEWLSDRLAADAVEAQQLGEEVAAACGRRVPGRCWSVPRRWRALAGAERPGTVYLVGAGPGDPGLLTARALELIAAADVILHDRLIPAQALDGARADAELLYVGKEGGGASVPQEETEELMIARAREGRSVVRLKGETPSSSVAAARRRSR